MGNGGNDTLDGGQGKDEIFTGSGFDLVYAADDQEDIIDCGGEGGYRIEFDAELDTLNNCPDSAAATTANDQPTAAAAEGSTRTVVLSEN